MSVEEREKLRKDKEDLDECKFCYKEVSSDFEYLKNMEKTDENLLLFFEMMLMFLKGCARP